MWNCNNVELLLRRTSRTKCRQNAAHAAVVRGWRIHNLCALTTDDRLSHFCPCLWRERRQNAVRQETLNSKMYRSLWLNVLLLSCCDRAIAVNLLLNVVSAECVLTWTADLTWDVLLVLKHITTICSLTCLLTHKAQSLGSVWDDTDDDETTASVKGAICNVTCNTDTYTCSHRFNTPSQAWHHQTSDGAQTVWSDLCDVEQMIE